MPTPPSTYPPHPAPLPQGEREDCFDELPAELAARILHLGQRIAGAQKRRYGVERAAFFFTGGDFPHVHAHVVPMVEKTDVTSRRYIAEESLTFRALPREAPEALAATAAELRELLRASPPPA